MKSVNSFPLDLHIEGSSRLLTDWSPLREKTQSFETKRWHFTHKRLRSAYRSIKRHLPYLFTFEDYPYLKLPNTTNSLDGFFSHLKTNISIHRGLKLHRKKKLIDELL